MVLTGSLTINGGTPAVGRSAITQTAQSFMTAFPDLEVRMDELVDQGETVLYGWTLLGTNTGPDGTVHRVRISGFETWRIGGTGSSPSLSGPSTARSTGASSNLASTGNEGHSSMIVALASPRIASSLDEGLEKIRRLLSEASARGAKIVFHPQHTGTEREGVRLTEWGAAGGPYYEKAMTMRSLENTIYFASVNYALRFQESATSLVDPSGRCQAHLPYGHEGVLVQAIDVGQATGLLATRYAPERYRESGPV